MFELDLNEYFLEDEIMSGFDSPEYERVDAAEQNPSEIQPSRPAVVFDETHVSAAEAAIRSFNDPSLSAEIQATFPDGSDRPLVKEYVFNEQKATLIGVIHTKQENATTQAIEATIASADPSSVAIVEGYHGEIPFKRWEAKTPAEVVALNGESGLTAKLARDRGLDVQSGEIPDQIAIQELKDRGHDPEDILLFEILRSIKPEMNDDNHISTMNMGKLLMAFIDKVQPAWAASLHVTPAQREALQAGDLTIAQEITNRSLSVGLPQLNARLTQIAQEYTASFSAQEIQQILTMNAPDTSHAAEGLVLKKALLTNGENLESGQMRQFFEVLADGSVRCHLSKEMMNHLATPDASDAQTSIGRVFQDDMEQRDRYLVRLIAQTVQAGKNPLVVFGGSHALKIAPALEKLMSEIK